MTVETALQDAHVYIFKRWVIDLITSNEKIASLRGDLLPMLAKMQWQSNLRKREGIDKCTSYSTLLTIVLPSTSNAQTTSQQDLPPNLKTDSPISVSLYITPSSQYTLRANSWQTYLLLNQHLALLAPGPKKHPSSKAGAKTSVGQDSLVAENCTLGERIQIRGSILATNVNVGSRSVIRGSVIMEGVEIGENAKLEGCIICRGAKIGERVSLTECRVAGGYYVQDGTKLSKENLIQLDDLEDDEEDDDDDDDDEQLE
jgi:translation initiation factor eIF-2B subunit gamma